MPQLFAPAGLSGGDWQRLQTAVAEFEHDRSAGEHRAVGDYLVGDGEFRRLLLVELLHSEIEHRLRGGQPVDIAELLSEHADLSPEQLPEFALTEYRIRRELEPLLDDDTFISRYPGHASTLRELIEHERAATTRSEAMPRSAAMPERLGSCVLRRELGRGGMGVVYEAHDDALHRTVAVKLLRNPGSDSLTARFRREAESVARLKHANIVQIFHFGEFSGQCYLVLEYLPGGSLARRIAEAPLASAEAATLGRDIARAVALAHDNGILHRDIKPANVLLDADGTAKLSDFGLAKILEGEVGATETGVVLGTPGYMAPEQSHGQEGPAADIYSLGALLYEALTGRPPFRAATVLETLVQTRERDPLPLRRLQPGVPRDLETIVLKCLRKSPAERYPTAAALADDLDRFLERRPIVARPVGLPERVGKWIVRNPVPSLLAALLLAAGIGLLAQWWRFTNDLRHERDTATFSAGEAKKESARAEASYRAARQSLAEFQKLRDDARLAEGELEPVRMDMLRAEAGFYRHFMQIQSDSPAFRDEQAFAAFQLAKVVHALGDVPAGLEATDAAIAIHRELVERDPDREVESARLIYLHEIRSSQLAAGQRLAEAEQEHIANLPRARAAVARWPGTREHVQTLAGVLHSLGLLQRRRGDYDGAADQYREAIRAMDPLVAASPTTAVYLSDRVRFGISLAKAEAFAKRRPAAREVLRSSLDLAAKAPKETAAEFPAASMIAEAQAELAQVIWQDNQPREAEPLYLSALGTLRELHRQNPNRGSVTRPLIYHLGQFAKVKAALNQPAESGPLLVEAMAAARKLYARAPGHTMHAALLAETCAGSIRHHLPTADTAVGLALVEKMLPEVEALFESHPKEKRVGDALADLLRARAGLWSQLGKYEAMLADVERSLALDSTWQRKSSRMLRAYASAKLGRTAAAAAEIAELAADKPRPDPFQVAQMYSTIAACVARDSSVPDADKIPRKTEYLDRAVAAIQDAQQMKTLAGASRWRTLAEADDFTALRERPEVKALLEKKLPMKQ